MNRFVMPFRPTLIISVFFRYHWTISNKNFRPFHWIIVRNTALSYQNVTIHLVYSFIVFFAAPEEKAVVGDLQRLVEKVDEMKNQRALLMLQLRESLRNDDITDQLALKDEDKNAMFQKEISKHQNVV